MYPFHGNINYSKNYQANNVKDGLRIIYDDPYHNLVLYSTSEKELRNIVKGVYEGIKKKNAEIEDINQQMLPTCGYYFRGIHGCLGVYCCEISMGTFEKNASCIAMFTGWNYNVLTDPTAREPISAKAMTSLAMLGYLATNGASV